ncbi:MAG: GNAT family N-acetyltransferase [Deltaproteobacteria bacterium]|nr:GNAT family N-acetyltransferase [Deltaproteobacteria bacterium]
MSRPPVPPGPIVSLVYRCPPQRRAALVEFFREAFPFYEGPGGIRMGLYESVDDPGLLLELVAYATEEDYARDQVRVERDPEMLAVLSRFEAHLDGPVEVRRMRPVPVEAKSDDHGELREPAAIDDLALNDHAAVSRLLADAGLPLPDGEDTPVRMMVARGGSAVVGCAGWERYGERALLRSVAVAPDARKRGVGRALVEAAIARSGAAEVYLLTTGASDFFARLGFELCDRAAIPEDVASSREMRLGCCRDAVSMRRAR